MVAHRLRKRHRNHKQFANREHNMALRRDSHAGERHACRYPIDHTRHRHRTGTETGPKAGCAGVQPGPSNRGQPNAGNGEGEATRRSSAHGRQCCASREAVDHVDKHNRSLRKKPAMGICACKLSHCVWTQAVLCAMLFWVLFRNWWC